jgi:hypothetical protein
MLSPDSSKIIFKIFQDGNIYSSKIKGVDGKDIPATNFAANRLYPKSSLSTSILGFYNFWIGFYSKYCNIFMIFYVLFGIYSLVKDRHICNVDMIHDSSDVWMFGSIYLLVSVLLGAIVECIFAPWFMFNNSNIFVVQIIKMSIHFASSFSFLVYEHKVINIPGAICAEMIGSSLYYWIFITYYLILFRVINFFIGLIALSIHGVNSPPKSTVEREKEQLLLRSSA